VKGGILKKLIFAASQIWLSMVASISWAADPAKVAIPQQKVLSSSNGRYVFGQVSDYRRDQYMVDTQTGRLWQIVVRPDESNTSGDGIKILQVIPYVNIGGEITVTPK